jgi:hypothetical protein
MPAAKVPTILVDKLCMHVDITLPNRIILTNLQIVNTVAIARSNVSMISNQVYHNYGLGPSYKSISKIDRNLNI